MNEKEILSAEALPKSYPVGAKKAFHNFQDFYGQSEGNRIFLAKALEQGSGQTLREKISSVYKKGAHLGKSSKKG